MDSETLTEGTAENAMEPNIITKKFKLLPPAKDVCQECAVKHGPEEPHDATSLYYQYSFHEKHGRWPEWRDAIAHCPDHIKEAWITELKDLGFWKD